MARAPERVRTSTRSCCRRWPGRCSGELDRLERLLTADGQDGPIMAWDWRYYDDVLRRTEYGVDQDRISEYLPLDPTVEGMFALTGEVFGLEYRVVPEAHAWHESVRLYEILDKATGGPRPLLRRPVPARGQVRARGGLSARRRPSRGRRRVRRAGERDRRQLHATFGRPPVAPAPFEVSTLFHEFGHILHMSLTRAEFARFSGAETEWDFVEAPSQIMEHWAWNPRSWRGSRAITPPASRCRPS